MKEKIFAFLKTKLTGVQDSYLSGVAEFYSKTITEEAQIETTFTDGVVDLLKLNAGLIQSEGDKRATEAGKTALKNFLDKNGLDENGKPKSKEPEPNKDVPEWFKDFQVKHTQLEQELAVLKKEKTNEQLRADLSVKLKEKGIPDSYVKGRSLSIEKPEDIETLVASVGADYDQFKQEMIEQGVFIAPPKSPGATLKEGEILGKSIAEKRNTNSTEGVPAKQV